MKMNRAAVMLIESSDGKFLMLERAPKDSRQGWCLPGGRMDKTDKDIRATAIRETFEETGIQLTGCSFKGDYETLTEFYVSVFKVSLKEDSTVISMRMKLNPEEHTRFLWVDWSFPTKSAKDFAGDTLLLVLMGLQ